ncbi:hypothetical protein L911_1280 [Vibrio fluvialis I21563]|nr:hypothetical protein L911_1280 [Vibrio fluvialis I21563]
MFKNLTQSWIFVSAIFQAKIYSLNAGIKALDLVWGGSFP